MKLLFWQWNAFMQKGMERGLKNLSIPYEVLSYIPKDWESDPFMEAALQSAWEKDNFDGILSVNFCPIVSDFCEAKKVPYYSWIYDSPLHLRNLRSLGNFWNRVYDFDRGQVEEFHRMGYGGVKYLPLAADPEVFLPNSDGRDPSYVTDIAFLGKLYQSEYAYLSAPLDQWHRGKLEGMVSAQQVVPSGFILDHLLTDAWMEECNAFYQEKSNQTVKVSKEEMLYTCACEATGRNRKMALALLSNRFRVDLYSADEPQGLSAINSHGYVDYYGKMPKVFANAKINLNISLCNIRTGIPLRVLDIMACGGFVITNMQEEIWEYFTPGEDIVVYENLGDLVNLCQYYLTHEEERRRIAYAGQQKIKECFTFERGLREILGLV
ncbi:MAG: glycosyltransferase [Lachnospiraceae bacterium]|nr:glycosyltransferase [Lachnospiraceae bacterium]